MMPKVELADLHKHVDKDSKPAYDALRRKKFPDAHEALRKFEAVYKANRDGKKLSEEELDMQETVLDILKREIDGPIDGAIEEIKTMKDRGDYYGLSKVLPTYKKVFKGLEKYDALADPLEKELRTVPGRKIISSGRRFYAYIERVRTFEKRLKGDRSPAHTQQITSYLTQLSKQDKDTVYGKAAEIAAKRLSDPKTPVEEPSAYVNAVQN